jgi:hypothetical protein
MNLEMEQKLRNRLSLLTISVRERPGEYHQNSECASRCSPKESGVPEPCGHAIDGLGQNDFFLGELIPMGTSEEASMETDHDSNQALNTKNCTRRRRR